MNRSYLINALIFAHEQGLAEAIERCFEIKKIPDDWVLEDCFEELSDTEIKNLFREVYDGQR